MRLMMCFSWIFLPALAQNVTITELSRVPLSGFGQVSGNVSGADIWTYTDAAGRPYALATTSRGLAVFNLEDPTNPVRIGEIPGAESNWQDVKTYTYPDGRTFAFLITQTTGSGIQIIDLSDLPNSVTLAGNYPNISSAHNLFIHPSAEKPYAYVAVAGSGPSRGVHVIDISDPSALTEVSHWRDFSGHDLYVHDRWADPVWDGKDVAVICTEQTNISIVDMSDKTNPTTISTIVYPQLAYSHSGWMDRTNRYLFASDESDEFQFDLNTTIRVFDLSSLQNPGFLTVWQGPTRAIDHNGFVMGDYLYLGNYTRGFTLIDINDPTNPIEVGHFDTYPTNDDAAFAGAWAAMPFLGDGVVAINDFNSGLIVVRVNFTPDTTLTHKYYLPLNPDGVVGTAYLRLINPGAIDNQVEIIPVNGGGSGTTRAMREISAGGMLYQDVTKLFNPAPAHYNWLIISSQQPLAVSLEGIGEAEAVAMPATDHLAQRLAIPHIAADTASFYTKANLVNGSTQTVSASVTTKDGGAFPLQMGQPRNGQLVDFEELFGGAIGADRTVAEAATAGQAALVGTEIFGGKNVDQSAGLTLTDITSTTLSFAHIASVENGWWTGIAVVNPSKGEAAELTVTARGSDGTVVAQEGKTLAAGGKILDFVNETNRGTALITTGIPTTAVWLEVQGSIPLTGYELFSDSQIRLFAGLQASTATATQMVLPFGGNQDWYAGVAIVNPAENAQNVSFTRIGEDGTTLQTASMVVAPGGRLITTAESLFTTQINQQSWIRVTSDGSGIHGFVIYGPFDSSWLCGLNGIPY